MVRPHGSQNRIRSHLKPIDEMTREELEDELFTYRELFGKTVEAETLARKFLLSPGPARLLWFLYRAYPQALTPSGLGMLLLDNKDGVPDRLTYVYVCVLRKKLGNKTLVEKLYEGYRLSDEGAILVSSILIKVQNNDGEDDLGQGGTNSEDAGAGSTPG